MGVPDALSRAFATYHEVTGDTGVWHEVVHGTGEVISITTPKKMSLPLNEDAISVNAIIPDLWRKIVGIYSLMALASQGENFEEEENILREGVTDPTALIIVREDYIKAYPQDRWLGPIWSAAQKPQEEWGAKEKLAMKYYSVMEDGLLYLAKAEDPGLKRLCVPASQNNTLRKLVLYQGHDARLHQGRDKTFDRIANHYYWPTLYNDVQRYVTNCKSCRKNGANLVHPRGDITRDKVWLSTKNLSN